MPIEFTQYAQHTGSSSNTLFRLTMSYDGSGRRISKTRWVKNSNSQEWEKELVTHYTGIGTEVREDFSKNQTKVVVNMPEGFGRYGVEDALKNDANVSAGEIPMMSFEWYIKNHLGSTMLVYGTQGDAIHYQADFSKPLAAYDYRAFGEMVELVQPRTGKVTENFTGKEHDEEIKLNYFGARYLDPMLGMWISVDPKRQFSSPYLYAGNGMNPVNGVDPDGNEYTGDLLVIYNNAVKNDFWGSARMKYELTRYHNYKSKFSGTFENAPYRGETAAENGKRVIHISENLSQLEQAATLVHESLEILGIDPSCNKRYNPQRWHSVALTKSTDGFAENPIQDKILPYYKSKLENIKDNSERNSAAYNDFLKANYEGTLTDGINNYPSDDIYKAEYESMNGL